MNSKFDRIAIVGMGGSFPGAHDLAQFWANVRDSRDCSSEPPAGRWTLPPEKAYDPQPGTPDRVHSLRAYYLADYSPNLEGLDLAGWPIEELDPLFHLALHIGNSAWQTARTDRLDRSRCGVVFGNIALPTEKTNALSRDVFGPTLGFPPTAHTTNLLNRFATGFPSALLARSLGFGLGGYSLDAACASSLYAIQLACAELNAGRADAMIAGGLSKPDSQYTQMGFAQLRALSLQGKCSPFDAAADGLVVGEGGCAFVLKRLPDAIAQGDNILGVITGIGLSNDIDGNLLLPASEGQLRAMKAAYAAAQWNPTDVSLIECHATGTPTGDAVEYESLRQLWGNTSARGVIGCVKSTVGHLLTGAGSAGLVKVLLAMRHQTLPPTANFATPSPKLTAYGEAPLRVLQQAEAWESKGPRRAAVSGFGFGGINAHVLVEEWVPGVSVASQGVSLPQASTERIAIVGTASSEGSPLNELSIPLATYRIPPKELEEMLPQQLLMLQVAAKAVDEVKSKGEGVSTGVFVGISLDLNTSNFHLRWAAEQLDEGRKDQVHPPLTANRTMGALGSIAASRIARYLGAGGSSFAVEDEEAGGLRSLALAVDSLRNRLIDRAVVGAVDLASDPRYGGTTDAAAAVVLKRYDDAIRDGDRIVAIVDQVQATLGLAESPTAGAATGLIKLVHAYNNFDTLPNGQAAYPIRDRVNNTSLILEQGNVAGYGIRATLSDPVPTTSPASQRSFSQAIFLLKGDAPQGLLHQLQALRSSLESSDSLHGLAKRWYCEKGRQAGRLGLGIVAESLDDLRQTIAFAERHLTEQPNTAASERFFYSPQPLGGELAFVYPGSGNHFADMGRELGIAFPEILSRQMAENELLASQYHAHEVWGATSLEALTPRDLIFAQVSLGTLVSDLLASFGIKPKAAIGYSLGESASMYGTRAWRERDTMFRRMQESSLFTIDLAGPCNSARRQWNLPANEQVDWLTGVLSVPADVVHRAIEPGMRTYVLIVNTADDCVIGGQRRDVEELIRRVGGTFFEVRGVTTAHCEVAEPVREPYRALHHLPTTPPADIRYYSGAWGKAYELNANSAADAITAAVLHTIDFPKVIQQAYADGVRLFVEIGPGASCTRMIGSILNGQPHFARAACVTRQDAVGLIFRLLANLHAEGITIDLAPLYPSTAAGPQLKIPVGYHPQPLPPLEPMPTPARLPLPTPAPVPMPLNLQPLLAELPTVAFAEAQSSMIQAHEAFLQFTTAAQLFVAQSLQWQLQNAQQGGGDFIAPPSLLEAPELPELPFAEPVLSDEVPRSLTFEQCMEFARGKVGPVLGSTFALADSYPTRVRLPDGPLQLVDRILTIEGEPKSLTSGRVVTEHHVHDQRWYLDNGRIPTCVAVEAGQADLFLSGFLGIDFETKGLAVYRLLDATVTFHRPLPAVGETILYDIHIDSFFRQGNTYLFRFHFESTVNGEPLLSMREGCAGFFTNEELASGKGVIHTELDRRPIPGVLPDDWEPYVPLRSESLSDDQVDALRQGDLVTAFGETFRGLPLQQPMMLPGGMLKLVHRIEQIIPGGGRYGLGTIRGEADIHPDDWFLTCHFIDDQVMPGTLMYECCMHTLRVLLMRMGFVGEAGEFVCEPVPGITSRLKCRGQVIASTKKVTYEVSLKEIGFAPDAFVLCDALMYADGKPIVEITNMSLRMTGLTRERLDGIWGAKQPVAKPAPLFDTDRITAFAIGKPSEAFGDRYRIFDSGRTIARLPGPPYQFLDRIVRIENCQPWVHAAGGIVEAEYDVPPHEWYFKGNRCDLMPFSVLLEVALQPCGWLAAYIGSALTSDVDISFRNLGGQGTQFAEVRPDSGTLTTTVKITSVSNSGGMIIQHYSLDVTCQGKPIYKGTTYFGFFSKSALANQVGLKELSLLPAIEQAPIAISSEFPFPDPMLKMVDTVSWSIDSGGPKGLGVIEGRARVNPEAWFFKAHFYQDPVWPGSLGLESMLQLMKVVAYRRWGNPPQGWQAVALNQPHRWVYRGQILPTDREVTVQAYISEIDDSRRFLKADGLLSVDGRIIYQMTDFSLQG